MNDNPKKKTVKTLLLNLPWKTDNRLGVRAGSRWPFTCLPEKDGTIHYKPFPFFLAYTASLLKKNGYKAKLADAIAEDADRGWVMQTIAGHQPDIIVIETSATSFEHDLGIIKTIKSEHPQTLIIVCGPHAAAAGQDILRDNPEIAYVLIGEYEQTVLETVKAVTEARLPENVPGVAYRKDNNVISNPGRELIDLNSLPWPERGDVPIYNYNDGFCGLPVPNVQIWSSRGCSGRCIFCLWPQTVYQSNRYRTRNPVDAVDEMEYLVKEFGFKAVYFDDDVFNADKGHFYSMTEQIKKRGLDIPWAFMARADLMDKEMLETAKNSGVYAIKYGIESASRDVLRECGKNLDLEKTKQAIADTRQLGIKVHLSFCLGLPGETEQTAEQTKQFISQARPDSFQLSLATAFPGTKYFDYAQEQGLLQTKRFSDYDAAYKSTVRTRALDCGQIERIKRDLDHYFNS